MASIILYECENNNHGCSGQAVEVEIISASAGRVVSSIGCSKCGYPWQEAGDMVYLPDWAESWEWAADTDDSFVRTDIFSNACRTNVQPRTLEDVAADGPRWYSLIK